MAAARGVPLVCLGLLLLVTAFRQAAAAPCTKLDASTSPFKVTYNAASSSGKRSCFTLTADRQCGSQTCCVSSSTRLRAVYLSIPSSCSLDISRMVWTANGIGRRPAYSAATGLLKLGVAGSVSGSVEICVDLSGAANCKTVGALCGGGSCAFTLNTFPGFNAASTKVSCCLTATASTQSCSVNNGGCSTNAVCSISPSGVRTCTCKSGFSGNGITCTDTNECATNNGGCASNAVCTNMPGGRTCACKAGYTGSGTTCTDINECATNNGGCSSNAICTNTAGSRTCRCKTGYTGTGVTCTDINECANGNGGCSSNAICTNTAGSRICACKAGFTGDGVTCTAADLCASNNGGCSSNAVCASNGAGGRTCTCNSGYIGDGITCTVLNLCAGGGGCSQFASCSVVNGAVACACNSGYSGDGYTCTQVNLCNDGNNGGCSSHATCRSSGGTVSCACVSGFTGDGYTCTDIDECATNNGGCATNAMCTNTDGSRVCSCKSGYTGDGFSCSGFNIQLINVGTDNTQDSAFQAAARRWEKIITIDVPDVAAGTTDLTAGKINNGAYQYFGAVDDITIFYKIEYIDGSGKQLGDAGPIYVRTGSRLPITAYMRFDSSDYGEGKTFSQATFNQVVLHEMGHALGFGSTWSYLGLVADCVPGSKAANYFKGVNANREYNALGCSGQLPLETESPSAGSSCVHFSETKLKTELMTPTAVTGGLTMPLSRITLGAMEDVYGPGSVDYTQADPFNCATGFATSVPAAAVAAAAEAPQVDPFATTVLFPVEETIDV